MQLSIGSLKTDIEQNGIKCLKNLFQKNANGFKSVLLQ